jgi:hypothetical protein
VCIFDCVFYNQAIRDRYSLKTLCVTLITQLVQFRLLIKKLWKTIPPLIMQQTMKQWQVKPIIYQQNLLRLIMNTTLIVEWVISHGFSVSFPRISLKPS